VRLTSVNGRFLELALRTQPRLELDDLEPAVRKVLAARVERGRLQIAIDLQLAPAQAAGLKLHWEVAEGLMHALTQRPAGLELAQLSLRDLLALPGFVEGGGGLVLAEGERLALFELVGRAGEALVESREREARELLPHLERGAGELAEFAAWLAEINSQLGPRLLGRLRERLATLLAGVEVAEDRLLAEAAIAADRADVTEEVQRLTAHVEHFRALLAGDGAAGKKLDFLIQEMLREVNTAGSKCREAGMGERVVAAKAALEKLREQVANVE
ncbi:MAG: DUF1732 domain-containing protein, partial [Acidobacteriota bacterium]